jgi:hypothetical protein
MAETPLLHIDGPALLFGGPYGNLQATAAVLAEAEGLEIPPARIICTGDLVGYCGDPDATIEMIQRSGVQVVMATPPRRGGDPDVEGRPLAGCGGAGGQGGFDERSAAARRSSASAVAGACCCGASRRG